MIANLREPQLRQVALAIGLAAALYARTAAAGGLLSGRVISIADGQGVSQAAVTLTLPDGTPGPKAITVFADGTGAFSFPGDITHVPNGSSLVAHQLGIRQIDSGAEAVRHSETSADGSIRATLMVESMADIADAVPGSAWLAGAPESEAKHTLLASCSSCHRFPSPRALAYAEQIEAVSGVPDGDANARNAWRNLVRHEAWRSVVSYMRSKHYAIFPDTSPLSLAAVPWPVVQNAEFSFFTAQQGELIAQFLTDHFPRSTRSLPRDAYSLGAPLGVTPRTVMREYALPESSLVREAIPVPHSPYIWGADVQKNRILRLDPASGETKWYPVDYNGSTGPHTIVGDAAGDIWVSMVDHDQFGRFSPKTEKWTLWTLQPASNRGKGGSLGAASIVHDMAIDSQGQLARDPSGKVWLTLLGTNMMGSLDPNSGAVAFYPAAVTPGLSPINHLLYSVVLAADGKCAWFSQVNGQVGCFNTQTHQIDAVVSFPNGSGPRRMARDNSGILWIPLFGSGQVVKYDTVRRAIVATYDLPDRASSPYSVAWDERRKTLWITTVNADVLYRLNPDSGQITVYPMPRSLAYMRQIGIDESTGKLIGTYGSIPAGSGPSMAVVIDVGD